MSYVRWNIEKYYPDGDLIVKGYAEDVLVMYLLSSYIYEKYPTIQRVHYADQFSFKLLATADWNNLPSPFSWKHNMDVTSNQMFILSTTTIGGKSNTKIGDHLQR